MQKCVGIFLFSINNNITISKELTYIDIYYILVCIISKCTWRYNIMKSKEQIFQEVTDHMIKSLEQDIIPWEKPWRVVNDKMVRPMSVHGNVYRGWNLMILNAEMDMRGLTDPRFITYGQAFKMGGQVRKGSKSIKVNYWLPIYFHQDNDDCPLTEKDYLKEDKSCVSKGHYWFSLKEYAVFSVEDVDGLSLPTIKQMIEDNEFKFDAVQEAEEVIENYIKKNGIKISHRGNRAYYRPSSDSITLPAKKNFKSVNKYYETTFHELTHSTGHKSRLNRHEDENQINEFGDESYAKEELVAEMGAGFLCASTGTEDKKVKKNRVAYIQSWLGALKNDKNLVPIASQQAQKAYDYIMK